MRVAVAQFRSVALDVTATLALSLRRLDEAAEGGADLVVFPELSLGGYSLDQAMARRASAAEAALTRLQAAVDATGTAAVAGLPLSRDGALYNATAVLRPRREPSFYAKTHLFRSERDWFAPGPVLWRDDVAGWTAGVAVCYEIGFPEIARRLALDGARLLLVPAAFGRARRHIWETACAARALENGMYVVAAGHSGTNGTIEFVGASMIVDPTGHTVARAGDEDALLVCDLDAGLVDEARAGRRDDANPYLTDRRPELY